jgi:hypothetical protein
MNMRNVLWDYPVWRTKSCRKDYPEYWKLSTRKIFWTALMASDPVEVAMMHCE